MSLSDIFPSYLDEVILARPDLGTCEVLREGQVITGMFPQKLCLDIASHSNNIRGNADPRVHAFGRHGSDLGFLSQYGTGGSGRLFDLHPRDAEALRERGFEIGWDDIVEWTFIGNARKLLLG